MKGLTRNTQRLPTFWVKTSDVTILSTPQEFYDTLLKHSRTATQRVSLASLYMGTGTLEQALVNNLCKNYCQQDHLKVRIVMDGNRGTRVERSTVVLDEDPPPTATTATTAATTATTATTKPHSAATLFQSSLLSAATRTPKKDNIDHTHLSDFRVGLFNMPLKTNDWFAKFVLPHLPPRYNELLTTFHLKAYVFDDTLIMSGANLSNDYFTSRQDRYWVIKNKALASLYHDIIDILYDASNDIDDVLGPQGSPSPSKSNSPTPPSPLPPKPKHAPISPGTMKIKLEQLMLPKDRNLEWSTFEKEAQAHTSFTSPPSKGWACIRPSLQCAALEVRDDEIMTKGLLERLNHMGEERTRQEYNRQPHPPPTTYVSTGYLNFHDHYKALLLKMCTNVHLLTASPSANGFFTASGISGSLPMAYSLIEQRLYAQIQHYTRNDNAPRSFLIHEYQQHNWTYHAKGLWFAEEQEQQEEQKEQEEQEQQKKNKDNGVHTSDGEGNYGKTPVDRENWYVPDDNHPSWGTTADGTLRGVESKQEQVKQKRERSGRGGGNKTRGSSHGMSGGSLTLIGSPNFGCRSVERDFESSLLIVTEDKELKIEMEREINQLMAYTSPVEATTFTKKGRKLSGLFNWSHGWWISPASRLVKGFM
jgi:CDP-diacylglycerol--glycerol-3-phosphate 3-phosphatidyltransferase